MDILEKNEYFTDDPYVKEIINDEIHRQMASQLSGQEDPSGKKKGKSAHEQSLFNLRNTDSNFKYLWADADAQDEIGYE